MTTNLNITPSGTRDLLFGECAKLRTIEKNLNKAFLGAGYKEIMTPTFEYLSLFSEKDSFISSDEVYKTMDNKGNMLAVRPDSTIPIARLVSTKLKNVAAPIRLFYNQKTFRMNAKHSGRNDEVIQSGVELIGVAPKSGDMEIIGLALEALKILQGRQKARFEIGHVVFFDSLCQEVGIEGSKKELLRTAICDKNSVLIKELLVSFPVSNATLALEALPFLFGGDEVIKDARKVFKETLAAKDMAYFNALYKEVVAKALSVSPNVKVIIDLGQLGSKHYYTGLVFSSYVSSIGEAVIKGGRYDKLYSLFSQNRKAIGFGVNIDLVAEINQTDITKRPVRIALTKGRIEDKTLELFEKMGLDCTQLINKGRKLIIPVGENLEVVLAKSNDVVTYVESGVCDLGIVGQDTILENNCNCFELLDFGFGKCKFAVAAKKDRDVFNDPNFKTVASKFPNVTKNFFEKLGLDIDIIKIDGSVELAPLLGLADAIVDLVETGTTLKENNLEVKCDIVKISTRLVVNKASLKLRKKEIDLFTSNVISKL